MHQTPTTPTPQYGKPIADSLGAIVGAYKAAVTRRIRRLLDAHDGPIWQRNYHERIIRNERELHHMRHYVANNPARWESDTLNDTV